MNTDQTCPNTYCEAQTIPDANYCHKCGTKLKPSSFVTKQILAALVGVVVLGGGYYFFEDSLLGSKPTITQELPSAQTDQRIAMLKDDAAQNPKDITKWRMLASGIQEKLSTQTKPDSSLIFDFIDALRGILSIDPKDKDALLAMGEVAYSQQAFDKAAEFYGEYLKLEPLDDTARANYGSALSFVGKFKEAEKELKSLLAKDPTNFQALAYLSISYSRANRIEDAKKIGEKALALSPDEEAKTRFTKYLASLDKAPSSVSDNKTEQPSSAPASVVNSPRGKFLQFLMQHAIIGPKIVSHDFNDKSLVLTMSEFPMSAMPEAAKAKLVERLKTQSKEAGVTDLNDVVFIDAATKGELGRINLGV